jgi:hypothetical protein
MTPEPLIRSIMRTDGGNRSAYHLQFHALYLDYLGWAACDPGTVNQKYHADRWWESQCLSPLLI